MACAPFVWPRQSALSCTALASWPAPMTTSIAPSVILPSWTWERESCEDLLDNLILQAADQKSKEDMQASFEQKSKEDMLAALKETSGKADLAQQTGAWKQMKKQTSPCQRFWNSGYCGYGDSCIYRHISQSPTVEESGQLDEASVRDETPRRKSSSTFNLNPLAKDFTFGKPLAKNFTNGQPIANDFVLAKPPKLWTPSGKDASPTYSSPPPFIPFTFSSPPPSPPLSFSFETLSVNMNTSVPPPMPKKSFYSTFTPANSNPTMVSQFEGMMRDWGSYGGRAAFN